MQVGERIWAHVSATSIHMEGSSSASTPMYAWDSGVEKSSPSSSREPMGESAKV
jgi:hypothetical protein